MNRIQEIAKAEPGVAHTVDIPGQSFVMNAVSSNFGSLFIILKPFHDRRSPELYSEAIAAKIRGELGEQIQGAQLLVFGAPAVDGLGNAGGFKLMLEGTGGADLRRTGGRDGQAVPPRGARRRASSACSAASARPRRSSTWTWTASRCKTMEVDLNDVFATLQAFLGSLLRQRLQQFGRTWQVNIQADAPFRINAETVKQFKVRNADRRHGAAGVGGDGARRGRPGVRAALQHEHGHGHQRGRAAERQLRHGHRLDGTGGRPPAAAQHDLRVDRADLHAEAGDASIEQLRDLLQNPFTAFVGAVVLVFLVLAALYESWSLPLSVILVVPMCLLCAMAGVWIASMDLNIFVQVGFVVLVGLASKNAILIVEFARDRQREGVPLFQATVEAARVRLRPIIMTSFAFILGVAPLVLAGGAGAEMRRTLGTAVFSGMLGVTLFGVFLTPVFFYVVRGLTARRTPPRPAAVDGPEPKSESNGDSVLSGDPLWTDPDGDHIAAGSQR